jgi:tetratricopeptide (TPR) repeat protein
VTVATVAEAFAQALQYHQAGNLRQAEQLYHQILKADPDHADTHHLLGVVAYQTGRFSQAVESIRYALIFNPWAAVYHSNLGVAQEALGQMQEALASFQQALRLQPDSADAHNAVGNALRTQGKIEEAAAHCAQALRIRSNFPEAHNNLANALYMQEKFDEAIAHYQEALRLRPDYAEAHSNMGLAFADSGRRAEGIVHYHEALRLNPDYAEAYNNLSIALLREGQFEEAEKQGREALRLKPGFADAYNNLGSILLRQRKWDEALAHYNKAMSLKEPFPEAHWNRSLLWLLLGNFEEGWPEYEWRWTQPGFTRRHVHKPQWDGSDLGGRTIVLYSEQGMGDTIQFIRYAPLVKERGGKVIVECHPPLVPLLTGVRGIDQLLPDGAALPEFELRAPLLSLPAIFHTTLKTVPATIPYLEPDAKLVERWRRELEPLKGFKIGIAWQGTPAFRYDRQRSIPLAWFAPLAGVVGVHLISLQKGPGADQLPGLQGRFPVVDLGGRLDDASGPFMDTAAIMKNLDLVISSDTAIPHLAGALGVPVWVALALVPDWRWLLEREDCPWYPTMRLFRQSRLDEWEDVFARLTTQLQILVRR